VYAIGMCIDERYLLPALVTIGSLAETLEPRSRGEAALRVLTLDLTRPHAESLAAYAKRAGFGSFDLRWARPSHASVMAEDSYITATTYLRFRFTRGFVQRPYLVYLDADTLVLADPCAPLEHLAEGSLGAVPDEFNPSVGVGTALPGLAEYRPGWRGRPYFNAGVLWASVGTLAVMRAGVERALVRGRRFIHHNDQDALNLWLLGGGAATALPAGFNRFEVGRFLERGDWVRRVVARPLHSRGASLIHYVGPVKPWMPDCPGTEDVRLYRGYLADAARRVRRLGELGIAPVDRAVAR
jgi:lipopolysaccharide biosynthesis glycosyltransferase